MLKRNKPCEFDIDISAVLVNSTISLSYINGKGRTSASDDVDKMIRDKYGKLDSNSFSALEKIKNDSLNLFYGESVQEPLQAEQDAPSPSNVESNIVSLFEVDNDISFDNNIEIKNENDLLKILKGNQLINNMINNILFKNIVLGSIVDLNNNKIVNDNFQLNENINNFKFELFKNLGKLNRNDFDNKFDLILENIRNDYNSRNLQSSDLNEMVNNKQELDKFISYIILSNFDSLINVKMSSIIQVSKENYGDINSPKYTLGNTKNIGSGFTDENILFTHTQLSTALIELTPMLNFDGTQNGNEFLKKDKVVSVFNKLKPLIPTTNIEESIGYVLAELIENKLIGSKFKRTLLNAGIKEFDFRSLELNDIDYSIIFSMYNMFFKSNHCNSIINKTGSNFLKNASKINKYSFYDCYSDNKTNLIDMYDVMVSTLSKVVPTTINEVNYNFEAKSLLASDVKSTIYNKYNAELKNKLLNNTLRFDKNYISNFDINFDDNVINLKINDLNIKYNVNGKISYFNDSGNEIKEINFPKTITKESLKDNEYDTFNKLIDFIENALNVNLNKGNRENLNYILNSKGQYGLQSLTALALNVYYIQNLYKDLNINDISKSMLNDLIKGREELFIDNKFITISPIFGSLAKDGVDYIVHAEGVIKGDIYKSTTVDNKGNAQPTYGLVSPISNYNTQFQQIRNENSRIFSNNPFIKYSGLMSGISRRGSIKNLDGSVTGSAQLTISDTMVYDIKYDYLQSKLYNNTMKYQPTVFSDKNTHSSIHINGNTLVEINGVEKRFGELTPFEHKMFFFNSQRSYFNEVKSNLIDLHNNIFTSLDMIKEYYNSTSYLKKIITEIPSNELSVNEIKRQFPNDFDNDLENEINNFNLIFNTKKINSLEKLNSILGCFKFKTYQKLAEKVFKGTKTDFVLEYHARPDKNTGIAQLNNVMKMYLNMFSDKKKFNESVFNDLSKYGFKKSGKDIYDEYGNKLDPENTTLEYELYMADGKAKFIKSLESNGVYFNLTDSNGNVDKILSNAVESYKMSTWIDSNSNRIINNRGQVLNPFLSEYFYSHTIVEPFQQATVGSVTQHKGFNKNPMYELADKTIAMYKRMVAHQATMHLYQQGKIDGIPYYNKVAYIKDPTIILTNILGEDNEQDVPDGAGFTLGAQRVLEQNSLNDQVAEFQGHKSISIQMDSKNGTAGLGKWAQYCITNQIMRMSPGLSNLNRKMLLGSPLKTLDGNKFYKFNINGKEVNLDLTYDYKGNKIPKFTSIKGLENGLFYKDKTTGNVIEILSMHNGYFESDMSDYTPTSFYTLKLYDHTNDMELLPKRVSINNLYDLWNALGGEMSLTPDNEGNVRIIQDGQDVKGFKHSETSHYALAWFINNIGCYKPNKTSKHIDGISEKAFMNLTSQGILDEDMNDRCVFTDFTKLKGTKIYKDSQLSVYQPLKEMFVGQATFVSAQKVGARNVNSPDTFDTNEDLWITDKVPTSHTGIQLDYGHHIEESDVTEMTQIISAAVFNGETPEYAQNMYNTIAIFVKNKVNPIINGLNSSDPIKRREILNKLEKQIVSNFTGESDIVARDIMNRTNDTLEREGDFIREKKTLYDNKDSAYDIKAITKELVNILNNGYNIAVSDQALYNKIFSTISSYFTKLLIRRKPTGVASVIMPSTTFVRLREVPIIDLKSPVKIIKGYQSLTEDRYNDYINELKSSKLYNDYTAQGFDESLFFKDLFNIPIQKTEVSMGMNLLYETINGEEERYITSIADIVDVLKNSTGYIYNQINKPRELQTSNAFWTLNGVKYSMQQNTNTTQIFVLKEFAKNVNDIIELNNSIEGQSINRRTETMNKINGIVNELNLNKEFYREYLPDNVFSKYFNEKSGVIIGDNIENFNNNEFEINRLNSEINTLSNYNSDDVIRILIDGGLIIEECN